MNALLLALLVGAPTPTLIGAGMPSTSSGVATALTDETGTGALVFGTSPTITTPVLTTSIEANTAGVASPNVLTAAESGKTLTNEGTTALNYHTLPTAAAGLIFCFRVQDGDGIRVTAASGDTIQLGNMVSVAAGYIQSTVIGAELCIEAINATEWITHVDGDWSVDGTVKHYFGGNLYANVVPITRAQIIGNGSNQLAHTNGIEIAAAEAGVLFVPVVGFLKYTFGVAAYGGGGNTSFYHLANGTTKSQALGNAAAASGLGEAASNTNFCLQGANASTNAGTGHINAAVVLHAVAQFTDGGGTATGTAVATFIYHKVTGI